MKRLITIITLGVTAAVAQAQSTTTTNCNTNGSQTNCTSNTTDYTQQNQQFYQSGQAAGSALGILIGRGILAHRVHSLRDKDCHATGEGSRWAIQSTDGEQWGGICTAKQAGVKK